MPFAPEKIATSPAPQNIYQPGTAVVSGETSEYSNFGESGQSLSVPLNPQYTFDNFVVGKTNEFAYAAARKVAESDNIPFNPLFLYSGVGLGKTHLMHAIAWHIKQRSPEKTSFIFRQKNSCTSLFAPCVTKTPRHLRNNSVR